ncbi:hypothetical protein FKM82_028919 [Ascaphus truei]
MGYVYCLPCTCASPLNQSICQGPSLPTFRSNVDPSIGSMSMAWSEGHISPYTVTMTHHHHAQHLRLRLLRAHGPPYHVGKKGPTTSS